MFIFTIIIVLTKKNLVARLAHLGQSCEVREPVNRVPSLQDKLEWLQADHNKFNQLAAKIGQTANPSDALV